MFTATLKRQDLHPHMLEASVSSKISYHYSPSFSPLTAETPRILLTKRIKKRKTKFIGSFLPVSPCLSWDTKQQRLGF